MPIYDYRCGACSHRFEVIHGVFGAGPETCPSCGSGPVTKAVVASAVHFKGTGWAKKERHAARSSASRGSTTSDPDGPTKAPSGDDTAPKDKGSGVGKPAGEGDRTSGAAGSKASPSDASSGSATGTTGAD